MKKTVLLLTGCINPNGMAYTSLNDIEERRRQYINAIHYYLTNTSYPVVFTENSGNDISVYFNKFIESKRFECLTFQGNKEKSKGKGYGECEIIQYALNNSRLLRSKNNIRVAKITGRLIIKNIRKIILFHQVISSKRTTFCMINSDLSFPDSRLILGHKEFYKEFIRYKEEINDKDGYYFEYALCDIIKRDTRFPFSPFFIQPQIIGVSGSTGLHYHEEQSSCYYILKYARYAGSQLHRFNTLYRNNKK